MSRRRPLLLAAAPLLLAALAHGAPPSPVKPDAMPLFREGLDAMSSHLWDIAASRMESTLQSPDLDAAGRKLVMFRLAEIRIRAGEFPAADKILSDPLLKDDPELPFWKAQSLAGSGRLRDAIDALNEKALAAGAPHRTEALFTRAAILQALGNARDALDTLAPLLKEKSPAVAESARLRSATLLLDLKQPAEALAMLPAEGSIKGARATEAQALRGRALLEKGDAKGASTLFTALLAVDKDNPAYLTTAAQQPEAAVGLAKALLLQRDIAANAKQTDYAENLRKEASDGLLAFLQLNENIPHPGPVFEQLFLCLPTDRDLAPNDAILTRLDAWSPPATPRPPLGPVAMEPAEGVVRIWPVNPQPVNEFGLQALYYNALGERRRGAKEDARQLLNRLRIENPTHPLALRSLWQLATWDQQDGQTARAALIFEGLQQIAGSQGVPSLQVAAQIKAAAAMFTAGDFPKAAALLKDAGIRLDGEARENALTDAGAALLATGNLPAFDSMLAKGTAGEALEADLALERALFLASRRDPQTQAALDHFIRENPDHPRLPEAILASAHAAMESPTPDLELAKARIDSLTDTTRVPKGSLALARIRLAGRSGAWQKAADLAQDFLKTTQGDPRQEEISYELGTARFQTEEYNAAQIAFEKLSTARPDGPLAQPALFWAARSAARGQTSQARVQSIGLFDKVIATKGPLSDFARLEKADVQIDLHTLPDAIASLDPWVKGMKKDDPLRMSAGVLLANTLYANDELDKALALYADLMTDLPADSQRRFELQYRTGLALEKKKENGKALEAYLSVLNAASPGYTGDWQWVDNCGIGARRLLEGAQKWEAAIRVAEKHSGLPSPGAKEAGERANNLRLKYMIME